MDEAGMTYAFRESACIGINLAGEEAWVVDEGIWGVWDERRRFEMEASDVGHACSVLNVVYIPEDFEVLRSETETESTQRFPWVTLSSAFSSTFEGQTQAQDLTVKGAIEVGGVPRMEHGAEGTAQRNCSIEESPNKSSVAQC